MKTAFTASRCVYWIKQEAQSGQWLSKTAARAEQSTTELTSSNSAYPPQDFGQSIPTNAAGIQRSDTRNFPKSRDKDRGC